MCVCFSEFASSIWCVTPVFTTFFLTVGQPTHFLSFSLSLSVSFTFSLASIQVLAVVSFRKCTALCWEVRYLPLGQPSFFLCFFFVIFIGCLREAELLCAHRTAHSALSSLAMILCRMTHTLAGWMRSPALLLSYYCMHVSPYCKARHTHIYTHSDQALYSPLSNPNAFILCLTCDCWRDHIVTAEQQRQLAVHPATYTEPVHTLHTRKQCILHL